MILRWRSDGSIANLKKRTRCIVVIPAKAGIQLLREPFEERNWIPAFAGMTGLENTMHHSRLSTIILDCRVDNLKSAVEFWSKALGKPVQSSDEDGDGKYAQLKTADDEPQILVQKVAHESRVHLDIETDDIEAEVERLEALGAKRVEFITRWWVMEAPTGHRFCIVRKQREEFGSHLNEWP